jgi:hypothetical protein
MTNISYPLGKFSKSVSIEGGTTEKESHSCLVKE